MVKITKRVVDAAGVREKDYVIWDDELPGFGLRVFTSGKRSYVIQYRVRVAHVATQLGFTASGHQRLPAKRRKSSSVGSLGEMTPPKSANSITRRSP